MHPSPSPSGPTLDSVAFDPAGSRCVGGEDGEQIWITPDGDRLSLQLFPRPPDLPAGLRHVFALLDHFERHVVTAPAKIVDFDVPEVDGVRALWMILKVPQQPAGMTYLGSLTLPFERCSLVLKVQCREHGITGVRDTAALVKAMHDGLVRSGADGRIEGEFHADDPRLDRHFPDHPVSRLRRLMRAVQPSIRLGPALKQQAPFPLLLRYP